MAAVNGSELHVAGIDVLVNGAALDPKWRNNLIEVKVVDSLTLPDMALVRITDPQAENIDAQPFQIGTDIEIKAASTGDRSTTRIFKGQIAAVEPEFSTSGCVISARAYDKAHRLSRDKKTRTFQQVSASNMVTKVAQEAGLSPDVTSTDVVHEFFQQSNESDWDFLWRLALMHDYEVFVDDQKLVFKPANKTSGAAIALRWQDTLLSFRPRMSGVQQPRSVNVRGWDPKGKQTITATSPTPQTSSQPGVTRSKVSNDLGGGTIAVTDRVVANSGEANALAKSTINRIADAFYEADGTAFGNPRIAAGSQVKIEGVGTKFGGTFTVTSSTHIYRGATGYTTAFQISGRSSRTILELIRPPQQREWSASLVVGVVTNNNDPDGMGRVRVKYPSLSDKEESAWARIATPSAGKERGLLMLPQPDEEVIVGFEHGDPRRPIVVGSVFNGKDKPGAELLQEKKGDFALVSNEKIHQHSKKDFEIKSDQKMTVEVQSDLTETVKGNFKHETTGNGNLKAQQYTIEAGSTMTVKGVSLTVEASASLTLKGATVDIQGSGPVNIKGAIINLG
jgi:phage protein D/phage baseplate assembly protein gpV